MTRQPPLAAPLEDAARHLQQLQGILGEAIVGQHEVIEELLVALFSGGHVLLEGLPGLGKTHLAKGLAVSLGLDLSRIQCTPDLMPSDITGSEMLSEEGARAAGSVAFRPGPVFTHLLLVDEINRAIPKTQSALLEAMQEGQVTYGGRRYPLPEPFWVIATQNPIELEGTYPLPEAQLDRFMFKLHIAYPPAEALQRIAELSLDQEPVDRIEPVLGLDQVRSTMTAARTVLIAEPLRRAAVELILSTLGDSPHASPEARAHFRYGASPRGLQGLLRGARVRALMRGRSHVALDDLRAVALPALRHRILLRLESEMNGADVDQLIGQMLARWAPVP